MIIVIGSFDFLDLMLLDTANVISVLVSVDFLDLIRIYSYSTQKTWYKENEKYKSFLSQVWIQNNTTSLIEIITTKDKFLLHSNCKIMDFCILKVLNWQKRFMEYEAFSVYKIMLHDVFWIYIFNKTRASHGLHTSNIVNETSH